MLSHGAANLLIKPLCEKTFMHTKIARIIKYKCVLNLI